MMSDEHTDARGSRTCSNGVSEVLASKAGLIAELFLNPETRQLRLVQCLIYIFSVCFLCRVIFILVWNT